MKKQPTKWSKKIFNTIKIIKNLDALKTIQMAETVEKLQQDVATNINTNLLQNEVYETGFAARDLADEVKLLTETGGAMDLNQKYLTTSIVSQSSLQQAIRAENMVVMHRTRKVRRKVCCTLVTCYEPNMVPVYHSGNANRTILFVHYFLPKGSSKECAKYVEDIRNGVRNQLEDRIAKSVEKKVRKDFRRDELVDGFSWNGSIWIIVLTSGFSVLLTMSIICGFFYCRDHCKLNRWDTEGIGNYIVEMKEKSAKKLSGGKSHNDDEESG